MRLRTQDDFPLRHFHLRFDYLVIIYAFAGLLLIVLMLPAVAVASQETKKTIKVDPVYDERWEQVRTALFPDAVFLEGDDVLELTTPVIPDDPAAVPVAIRALIPQTPEHHIKRISLLVDHNPAPLAAVFHLTPKSGVADLKTRVRVGEFSWIRAIAETSDGKLYMAKGFVKASGGCDVSPRVDHEKVESGLGDMQLHLPGGSKLGRANQAHLKIAHPNYNGMQVGNVAGVYIPARLIQKIEVSYASKPVLVIDGHMSLSADPQFRFHYVPEGDGEFDVRMLDSDSAEFRRQWPVQIDQNSN